MFEATSSLPTDVANHTGRRAAARLRLSIPVRLTTIYETHNCVLLDLSRTGAQVALPVPLTIGEGGILRVGQLEVFGEVIRQMIGTGGGVNGIVFEELLPQAAVLGVRHHAETFRLKERDVLREKVRRWVAGEN